MKKLLLSCFTAPLLALAQPVELEKKVVCDEFDKLVPVLEKKYGEIAFWVGKDKNTSYAVTLSKDSTSWTILQYSVKENIVCVLGSGVGYRFRPDKAEKSNL